VCGSDCHDRQGLPLLTKRALGGSSGSAQTIRTAAAKLLLRLAVESWRQAYFPVPSARGRGFPRVAIATARSGNVIGAGTGPGIVSFRIASGRFCVVNPLTCAILWRFDPGNMCWIRSQVT